MADEIKQKVILEGEDKLTPTLNQLMKSLNDFEKKLNKGDIKLKINQGQWDKSIDSANKKLITKLTGNTNKVTVIIDADKLNNSVDKANKILSKLKNVNVNVNTDARSITAKIQNISGRLDTLSKKKYNIDGNINTTNAESKIIRLATYINQLNSKDIKPKVDEGISNIVKLSTYLNQLKSKDLSLVIDANISKAKSGIMSLYNMVTELVGKKYKLDIDTNNLTGKNSQLKTTANTLKNIGETLKKIKSKTINIGVNTGSGRNNISGAIRNIRSLNNLLQSTRNNIIINIKLNDNNNAIVRLRELSQLLRDIKRNSNLRIRTGSYGGGGGFGYGSGYGEPSPGNFLVGAVQFFGRASKGFGSALEALARVSQNMIRLGGTVGRAGVALAGITATAATVIVGFNLAINSVREFGEILLQVGTAIYKALKPGIDLYNQRTRAELALGAGARSMATIDGRQITDEESKSIGRQLTSRAIRDAARSVFNPAELIDAMQGTMPMLYARGMTAEQAYQTTKGVASVAKLGRLAPNQVLQETRDLAQGSITARTSQVANLLGITNEDLAQYKGNADALYDYLMDKFREYSKALDEYAKTPVGAFEQLQETIAIAGDSIVSDLAQPFVEVFHTITASLGSFVDEQGHVLDENGQYLDEYGNKVDGVGDIVYQVSEPLQNFADALEEIIRYLIQAIDELVEYSGIADNSKAVTQMFVDVMKFLIDSFVTSVKLLRITVSGIINFGKTIEWVAVPILEFLYRMINLVRIAFSGWEDLFTLIGGATGNLSVEDVKSKLIANEKLRQELAAENERGYASKFTEFLEAHGFTHTSTENALTEAYDAGRKRYEEESRRGKGESQDLNKVQGKGTVDTKSLEKANKEAIKQSQKELKARLAELRTLLADKLDELKEILEENELKYSQGFMTIDEYYSQKADIELQQARESLEEARKERKAIETALYQNEEDRARDLAENDKKINKYTKETAKAEKGIRELSRAFRDTTKMLGSFVNALNSGKLVNGKVAGSKKIDSESARALSEKDPYTYIAIKTAEKINEQGGNVKAGWLLGQMRQEVGNLDEGSELSRTHNNYSGIKWYSGAIGSKGSMSPEGDYYQKFDSIDDYIAEKVKVYMQSNFRDASFNSRTAEEFVSNLYSGGWFESGYNSYVQNVVDGERVLEERLNSLGMTLDSLKSPVESFSGVIDESFSYFNPMTWAGEENSSSSVAKQMEGLQQSVVNAWNEVARKYFEATGEKIGINSFTGDLASDYNPHEAGEKGHQAGWKIDIDYVSNIIKLVELLNEIGAAIGDEDTHLDISFWGGTGGEQLGKYRTGELFHENASQYMQAISDSVGQAINNSAYLSKTALEEFEAVKEFESKTAEMAASIMEGTFGYPMQKIQQLQMEYENEVRLITGRWVNSKIPEYREAGLKRLEVMKKKFDLEVFNLTKNSTEQMFEYQLEGVRREIERSSNNIALQRTNVGSSINKLVSYIDSEYGLGKLIDEMEQARQTLLSLGHYVEAREIGDKLAQLKDLVIDAIDSWIEQGQKYWNTAEEIFNATSRFTPTQREFAEREFNASRAQSEYEGRIAKGNELASQYEKQVKAYNDLIEKQKELIKGTKEYENGQKDITRALQDKTRTEALIAENEQMKKLADLTRQMPDYLDDVGKAARDALDNGLVEFLTDGILEAESLGDALRNLATGILKEIQQVSAKWIVKDLMNSLFGTFDVEEETPTSVPYAPYLTTINETLVTGFSGLMSALTDVGSTGVAGTGQVGLGVFSKPWEQSELNPNGVPYGNGFTTPSVFGATYPTYPVQNSMFGTEGSGLLSSETETIVSSIYDVSETISTASSDLISNLNAMMNALINSLSIAFTSSENGINALTEEQIMHNSMAEEQLDESIQESYNIDQNTLGSGGWGALLMRAVGMGVRNYVRSRKKKARGGIVTGEGTSTSDSIPTMLSNGEYVINAKAVKKYGSLLDLINSGTFEVPKFADGGLVGDEPLELEEENYNDNMPIIEILSEIVSRLSSILAYVKSISERIGVSESEDGTINGSNSDFDGDYTSYGKTHEFSKKSGSHVSSFLHWAGLGTDTEENRLVDQLGDDVPKSTKMMVDLLQVIADNTYTMVNLLTVITTIDFLKFAYNIITHGIRGLGMKDGGILKLAKGGTVYHNNGLIRGAGTSTSDSIPAMLSNGEAVLNAKAVRELGTNFITAVNNGNFSKIRANIPHFADGGFTGDAYQGTARGMTDFAKNIGANVTTNNQMNIALVEDRNSALEHFMRSPRGQNILVDFMKGNGRVFSRFNRSV